MSYSRRRGNENNFSLNIIDEGSMNLYTKSLVLLLASCSAFTLPALAGDSAANRGSSSLLLAVQPVGIHVPTLIAPPLQLGYFITGDFVVGLSSGSASVNQDEGNAKSSASFKDSGVWFRYFTGNSFNFLLGYNKRSWTADATVSETQYTSTYGYQTATATAGLTADATVATIGLANHWTFDGGFTLGVDWLLGSSVLSSSTTTNITTNAGVNSTTLDNDLNTLADTLNKISGLGGLTVLTLGWAF